MCHTINPAGTVESVKNAGLLFNFWILGAGFCLNFTSFYKIINRIFSNYPVYFRLYRYTVFTEGAARVSSWGGRTIHRDIFCIFVRRIYASFASYMNFLGWGAVAPPPLFPPRAAPLYIIWYTQQYSFQQIQTPSWHIYLLLNVKSWQRNFCVQLKISSSKQQQNIDIWHIKKT